VTEYGSSLLPAEDELEALFCFHRGFLDGFQCSSNFSLLALQGETNACKRLLV
jgi:hypothetical protein